MMFNSDIRADRARAMSFAGFVGVIASLMAVNALAIDLMLPALPQIGHALGTASENQQQWIITSYLLGFGIGQIAYGPLSDRYGRKPVLLISLALYAAAGLLCSVTTAIDAMLAARIVQGLAAAASRVISVSIVRDLFAGRQMARVMSLSFTIFLAVPIIAPSLGQFIMLFGSWHLIFYLLAAFGAVVATIIFLRVPETLNPADRRAIAPRELLAGLRLVLGDRVSIGYTLAGTVLYGGLVGYIGSAQQIFSEVFGVQRLFPILFAICAATMGVAAYLNARFVERFGARRISQGAVFAFIILSACHVLIALGGYETVVTFTILQGMLLGCSALAVSNFNSIAMEPVGHMAGTASSIQGFISTVGASLIGSAIGQNYNGTTMPLAIGYLVVSCLALVIVLFAERGRLFHPHHAPPVALAQ